MVGTDKEQHACAAAARVGVIIANTLAFALDHDPDRAGKVGALAFRDAFSVGELTAGEWLGLEFRHRLGR